MSEKHSYGRNVLRILRGKNMEVTMEFDLLPCSCGGTPKIQSQRLVTIKIYSCKCSKCGKESTGRVHKEDAVDEWNYESITSKNSN